MLQVSGCSSLCPVSGYQEIGANLEELVKQRTAQLNHANQQLKASQTALQEIIGNISHDLKTPLTVLNNYLELLGDDMIASSEQERTEYLGIAYHKNLDLQRLIHNLFEVTRMEGGTIVQSWPPTLPETNGESVMRDSALIIRPTQTDRY